MIFWALFKGNFLHTPPKFIMLICFMVWSMNSSCFSASLPILLFFFFFFLFKLYDEVISVQWLEKWCPLSLSYCVKENTTTAVSRGQWVMGHSGHSSPIFSGAEFCISGTAGLLQETIFSKDSSLAIGPQRSTGSISSYMGWCSIDFWEIWSKWRQPNINTSCGIGNLAQVGF